MKALIVLIATVAATSAFAKGGSVQSANFGCQELRSAVSRNGVLIVNGFRAVADAGYCSEDSLATVWLKTADAKNCPISVCDDTTDNEAPVATY